MIRVSCPFCDSLRSGRYDRQSREFVCTNSGCSRHAEVVDYSHFVAEVDRQTDEFFSEFHALAHGKLDAEIKRIAEHLLTRGVEPFLALQLVAAWNEVFATPPMGRELLLEVVESVAGNLREAA